MVLVNQHLKKEVNSIWKNSLVYMTGRALSQAAGFFMIPIYTKYILPQSYGAMALIEILTAILLMIVAVGVADSMPRFYYQESTAQKRREMVSTIIISFGILALIIIIITLLLSDFVSRYLFDNPKHYFYFKVAIVTVWFGLINEIAFTYLRMIYKAKLFVIMTFLQLCISLTLNIWFVVYLNLDILGIFTSTLISQTVIAVILLIIILKEVGIVVSPSVLKKLLIFGIPLIPSRIGLFFGFVSNRFFLRWMGSPDPATALTLIGLFSLGSKFGAVIDRFINVPFNSFWGPRRMELLSDEDPQQKYVIGRICTYASLISIFLSLAICTGINDLIQIMTSPKYHDAGSIVPYIVASYFFLSLERHFQIGILFKKKNMWLVYTSILSLSIIIAWNYFLIPKFGLIGAATSNMVGLAVRAFVIFFISQRVFYIPYEMLRLLHLVVIAFAVYSLCYFINIQSLWMAFLIKMIIVSCYPFVLLITCFFTKTELVYFKEHFFNLKNLFYRKEGLS